MCAASKPWNTTPSSADAERRAPQEVRHEAEPLAIPGEQERAATFQALLRDQRVIDRRLELDLKRAVDSSPGRVCDVERVDKSVDVSARCRRQRPLDPRREPQTKWFLVPDRCSHQVLRSNEECSIH